MTDSILTTTKKALDIPEDYDVFDGNIVMHINSVFSTLNQLGVGPIEGFQIEDAEAVWADYLVGTSRINAVRSYMYLRVKSLFDPPTTSYMLTAIKEQINELEWRINADRETRSTLLLGEHKKITGHAGDEYKVRLANPVGKTLINASGSYSAEFMVRNGRYPRAVTLDVTEQATGTLFLPVVIQDGTFTVYSLNPRRTILTLDVAVQ